MSRLVSTAGVRPVVCLVVPLVSRAGGRRGPIPVPVAPSVPRDLLAGPFAPWRRQSENKPFRSFNFGCRRHRMSVWGGRRRVLPWTSPLECPCPAPVDSGVPRRSSLTPSPASGSPLDGS